MMKVARDFELDVKAVKTFPQILEPLAASKRARLDKITTTDLDRDTLKGICEECGLDQTGKKTRTLVDRTLSAGGALTNAASAVDKVDLGFHSSRSLAPEGTTSHAAAAERSYRWEYPALACDDAPVPGKICPLDGSRAEVKVYEGDPAALEMRTPARPAPAGPRATSEFVDL